MQPKYGHHDDAYMLPERCRQALRAQARAGLSKESDYGLVKLTQNITPEQADEPDAELSCLSLFDASAGNTVAG
jgi:hypothetical protein